MTIRYDSIFLSEKSHIDADGYLYDTPVLTLAEKVFVYKNHDGSTRREYRPATEVFNAYSLKTFKGKPVTSLHPEEMLNSKTTKNLSIGTILSEGRKNGDKLEADIVIHDPKAIGENRELSLGYNLDLDFTKGVTPKGEAYDAVQKNIIINHLAVVPKARAGKEARLNIDGNEEIKGVETMVKINIKGIAYDAAPEVANELKELQEQKAILDKEIETLKGERDGLKSKIDSKDLETEKIRKDNDENFDKKVKERICILKKAQDFNITACDDMSNDDIKKAVIKAVHGDCIDLNGKSIDYISALFDTSNKTINNDALARQRKAVFNTDGKTEKIKTSAEARLDMIAKMKNGGKNNAN